MRTLSIDAIQLDFQPPENLDEEKVREYVGRLLQGERIESIIVRFDGTNYLLQDGFHRVEASRRVGLTEIEAEISPGTRADMEAEFREFLGRLKNKLRGYRQQKD